MVSDCHAYCPKLAHIIEDKNICVTISTLLKHEK
jgi:hypothetical protein